MSLSIMTFWAFFLLLLVPVVLWVARRSYADITTTRSKILLALRTACIALTALALVGIVLTSSNSRVPVSAVFCVDVSDSISGNAKSQAEAFVAEALKSRSSGDRAGIIAFGSSAQVTQALESTGKPVTVNRTQAGADTGLAEAISLGMLSLPEGADKRIVVLSDGYETIGDARRAADDAAVHGVRIDTVALPSGANPDVAIASVKVPSFVRQSQPFDVTVKLAGSAAGDVAVRLYVDDMTKPSIETAVSLSDSVGAVTFPVEIDTEGNHVVKVVADFAGDAQPENNAATAIVKVGPKPSVLIVAENKDHALYVASALKKQEFSLQITTPDLLPKYAEKATKAEIAAEVRKLLHHDVIIMSNVPAKSLTREQMLLVNSYVYDFGGVLVMAGGKESFGSGGYYKTPIEAALPIYTDPKKDAPVFAVVLIIDKSWSMGDPQSGKISKIDVAKESAIAAVEKLAKTDHLAVISFDTEVHTILPMQAAENIPSAITEISKRESFGLTNFYPALISAHRTLKTTVADYKHAILLSDGRPSGPPKDYPGQLEKMVRDRVVVSTIAIGVDADKKLMNNIAAWGKGQYYYTQNIETVPEVIMKETGRLKELLLVEGQFKPRPGPRPFSPILKGIDVDTMPAVLGFNRSRAKETAQVQIIVSAKDEPLLASWKYGAGSAVAFTSDAGNTWCPDWVGPQWEKDFARFWRQLVLGSLQLRRGDADYQLALLRDAGSTRVMLDSVDRQGRFFSGQKLTAVVTGLKTGSAAPEEVAKLSFEPAGPGRYAAELPVGREVPVLLDVADANGNNVLSDGDVVLAPPEYLTVGTNDELLKDLRKATGGRVVKPEEVFERSDTVALSISQFDYLLLTLATILFAVDIFIRRLPALLQVFNRQKA